MSDPILNNACDFFASDQWWSQILDFMLSRCEPFRKSSSYSFEEYQIFQEYMKFIQNLIDVEMCQQINVTPEQFEDALLQGLQANNPVAISLKDTIVHASDFVLFYTDMVAHNERIEKEVENVMKREYGIDIKQEENHQETDNIVHSPRASTSGQINNVFQVHEPAPKTSSNVPRSNISPPLQLKGLHSNQQQQVVQPPTNNPPRNPRCIQNRLSMALPAAIAQRLHKSKALGALGAPALSGQLPGILSRKKETLQTIQSGMPSLKIPKAGPVKLPPLGKSPRF